MGSAPSSSRSAPRPVASESPTALTHSPMRAVEHTRSQVLLAEMETPTFVGSGGGSISFQSQRMRFTVHRLELDARSGVVSGQGVSHESPFVIEAMSAAEGGSFPGYWGRVASVQHFRFRRRHAQFSFVFEGPCAVSASGDLLCQTGTWFNEANPASRGTFELEITVAPVPVSDPRHPGCSGLTPYARPSSCNVCRAPIDPRVAHYVCVGHNWDVCLRCKPRAVPVQSRVGTLAASVEQSKQIADKIKQQLSCFRGHGNAVIMQNGEQFSFALSSLDFSSGAAQGGGTSHMGSFSISSLNVALFPGVFGNVRCDTSLKWVRQHPSGAAFSFEGPVSFDAQGSLLQFGLWADMRNSSNSGFFWLTAESPEAIRKQQAERQQAMQTIKLTAEIKKIKENSKFQALMAAALAQAQAQAKAAASAAPSPPDAVAAAVAPAAAAAKWDVFLSHKQSDTGPIARTLWVDLTARGYSVFLDQEALESTNALLDDVRASKHFVYILSPNIFASKWCTDEVTAALQAGLHVVPMNPAGTRYGPNGEHTFPPDDMVPANIKPALANIAVTYDGGIFYRAAMDFLIKRIGPPINDKEQ